LIVVLDGYVPPADENRCHGSKLWIEASGYAPLDVENAKRHLLFISGHSHQSEYEPNNSAECAESIGCFVIRAEANSIVG
jgi:hypothetical protein